MVSGKQITHMTDVLFTLALFCLFAASSLLVVLIGAGVYSNTMDRMSQNFDTNTSVTYVTTKIRQHDATGAVYTDELGGVQALVLEQELDGTVWQTWIYFYDNMLYELFIEKGAIHLFSPGAGQGILEVSRFSMDTSEEGLLLLTAGDETGRQVSQLVALRS